MWTTCDTSGEQHSAAPPSFCLQLGAGAQGHGLSQAAHPALSVGQGTFLRRTFVVLLTGGRQVSFLFESECCCVDIPVVLHLTAVPGSSLLNLQRV